MWRFLMSKDEWDVFLFTWHLQHEIRWAFGDFKILRYRVSWVFVERSCYLQFRDYELIQFKYGTAKALDFQQELWVRDLVSGLGTWEFQMWDLLGKVVSAVKNLYFKGISWGNL